MVLLEAGLGGKLEHLDGYCWFVAIFTMKDGMEKEVLERMKSVKEISREGIAGQGFCLTGERTLIFVGQTNSSANLQKFCSSVIYGPSIGAPLFEAQVFHALEFDELGALFGARGDLT